MRDITAAALILYSAVYQQQKRKKKTASLPNKQTGSFHCEDTARLRIEVFLASAVRGWMCGWERQEIMTHFSWMSYHNRNPTPLG